MVPKMVGPACLSRAKKKSLVLWTWGDMNSFAGNVELQRKWGVDAVICDNIQKLTRKEKKASVFEEEFGKKLGEYMDSVGLDLDQIVEKGESFYERASPVPEDNEENGGGEGGEGDESGPTTRALLATASAVGLLALVAMWKGKKRI